MDPFYRLMEAGLQNNILQNKNNVAIALQGGGTHCAFAWGVLSHLLSTSDINVTALSGFGIGAINATLVADGLRVSRYTALNNLNRFWQKLEDVALTSPMKTKIVDKSMGNISLTFPNLVSADYISKLFSPHQFNLFENNPLKDPVERIIDFDALQTTKNIKLFVNATEVVNGKGRLFTNADVTLDSILASCCVPFLYRPITIDDTQYWDGGYSAHLMIQSLVKQTNVNDIIFIRTQPEQIEHLPVKATDVLNRANEIASNNHINLEIDKLKLINKFIETKSLNHTSYRSVNLHVIDAEDILNNLGASSKLNTDASFLLYLKETGYQAASDWLTDELGRVETKKYVETA
ncbi:MAG: patatin-like phospholipase family protein [Rickettsiales bacterium]|nr:patatin-like phospholipase family protein [Rickettsiales bacterium]